ncbi:MAG TPA: glycosyltransferase, partial [Paracoccaceae bacterium]|nr:glycosyltransferase [Paracoccaceae bacterium]
MACEDEAAVAKVNFQRGEGEVVLHLDYRRFKGGLVVNHRQAGSWNSERPVPIEGDLPGILPVTIEGTPEGKVIVTCPGGRAEIGWATPEDLERSRIWIEGTAIQHATEGESTAVLRNWRLHPWGSGFAARSAALERRRQEGRLEPGLTFLIRAKNEAPTVGACIESVAGLGDEIIFVDNGSTDGTALIAEKLKGRIFELKTFLYPHEIPRAGAAHAREVLAGGSNTLGHYYNWCLAQGGRGNFVKWDADYAAIRENLAEMISLHCLRTREDNFVLWFSGLEVYTDGKRYWVDRISVHAEFRVFSARHGHEWVNLPPWEEIDQRALYRAQKLFYPKPVYLELF